MMGEEDTLEAMKRTMIRQETVFRHQVLELHRVYWTQKNMLRTFYNNGFGSNSEHIQKPFITLAKEMEEKMSCQWRSKGNSLGHISQQCHIIGGDKHHQPSHLNHNRVVVDLEDDDLTLGRKYNNNEISSTGRFLCHSEGYLHVENMFDLNKTIEFMPKEDDRVVSPPIMRNPLLCNEVMSESQLPTPSDVTSCERTSRDSVLMTCAKLPYTGQDKSKIIQLNTPFANSETLSSGKVSQYEFDLNMVQPEESSAFEDTHVLLSSTSAGSSANSNDGVTDESHVSGHPIANLLSESSGRTTNAHKLETVNSLGMASDNSREAFPPLNLENSREGNHLSRRSNSVRNTKNATFSEFDLNSPVQLERIAGFSNGFGDVQPKASGCLPKSVLGFSKNSTENNFHSSITDAGLPILQPKASAGERSEEDTLSSSTYREHKPTKNDVLVPHEQYYFAGDNNDVIRDNFYSEEYQAILKQHVDRKMVVGTCPTWTDPPAEVCGGISTQENSSDCTVFVAKMQTKQNIQWASQVDHLVKEAAKTLVDIHINDSSRPPYPCLQVVDMKLEVGKNSDQPQCSSDSFELLVLALPECVKDDCSSSLVVSAETEMAKDDSCRFKTRSGRRLRDFQKDILPGLVSLSRHEICEDLHAFTEIIKSDDSSKKGLSKALRGNWGNTVRTRRSRLYPTRKDGKC